MGWREMTDEERAARDAREARTQHREDTLRMGSPSSVLSAWFDSDLTDEELREVVKNILDRLDSAEKEGKS